MPGLSCSSLDHCAFKALKIAWNLLGSSSSAASISEGGSHPRITDIGLKAIKRIPAVESW